MTSSRLEDQQADIIGWFASHNNEAIRAVVEAGQATITERRARGEDRWDRPFRPPTEDDHDHEFESCCAICGATWHEVNA